ncbi:NAD(P)-binding protein [Halococcus saccharolyticus]|uniref:Potassium channel-like protein n=1 Tax=Halococcus saccharolyticus DSM 5350 TaxID=1227455 RepID=M0QSL9_9EURY|nr:NAD(P)-binding protein [Halococcus saccharolyticus]EMA43642.1 potassium channel-like protein [Halococcus saccharolyticus DSM 5350]
MNSETVVIGGDGAVGEVLAGQLVGTSAAVVFLDEDERAVEHAAEAGADARVGDPSEAATLDREDIEEMGTAIVASQKDSHNLLVAQLLQLRRTERVIALVNDPKNVEAFTAAGIEPVSASTVLAGALDRQRRGAEIVETERSLGQETEEDTAKRHLEHEESTDDPKHERVRSDGAGVTCSAQRT